MKTLVMIPLFSLAFFAGFSQNFKYEHSGGRAGIVKKEQLRAAKLVSDAIPDYPAERYNKFFEYTSIEVSATCNGQYMTAKSSSDLLTPEQKAILNTADPGTDIIIKINSKAKDANDATAAKVKEVEYAVTPGPDTEAAYPGGDRQMNQYLKETIVDKISDRTVNGLLPPVSVAFIVNEDGQVQATIYRSSGDQTIDQLALGAFHNMPKWKPAANSKGQPIKQKFVVRIGDAGC